MKTEKEGAGQLAELIYVILKRRRVEGRRGRRGAGRPSGVRANRGADVVRGGDSDAWVGLNARATGRFRRLMRPWLVLVLLVLVLVGLLL